MSVGLKWDEVVKEYTLPALWEKRVASSSFAFQPIVNIHTGLCIGYECLLRGWSSQGFDSIQAFFDLAHRDGFSFEVGERLRERALILFSTTTKLGNCRLFFNLDSRELLSPSYRADRLDELLSAPGMERITVCLELCEHHPFPDIRDHLAPLAENRKRAHRIALDDFGSGYSGLQLLYAVEPDFIKIDRFFISDIASDARKRLFVSSIVGIAHVLGAVVIAEGVETEKELTVCRAIGCDLVQGYFVHAPTGNLDELRVRYEVVSRAASTKRCRGADKVLIESNLEPIPALCCELEMIDVLECFRQASNQTFFPVVTALGEPLGILRENALRSYAYSVYGKDLLRNRSLSRGLLQFVERCPITDVNTSAERVLELFSLNSSAEGILVVDNMRYIGFLSAHSLLRIVNEKSLLLARDQNPLTRLPGNVRIHDYIASALGTCDADQCLVHFDFDDFKPFNDTYGFRAGDRAIQLFADLLQKLLLRDGVFVGHIGGDDFFVGFTKTPFTEIRNLVETVCRRFREDATSLYPGVDRERGYIEAIGRDGILHQFTLLSVSAAVLFIPAGASGAEMDSIIMSIAGLKKAAKANPEKIALGVVGTNSFVSHVSHINFEDKNHTI